MITLCRGVNCGFIIRLNFLLLLQFRSLDNLVLKKNHLKNIRSAVSNALLISEIYIIHYELKEVYYFPCTDEVEKQIRKFLDVFDLGEFNPPPFLDPDINSLK